MVKRGACSTQYKRQEASEKEDWQWIRILPDEWIGLQLQTERMKFLNV
jgi:hypothetical protein